MAADFAELRNGFNIRHERRQLNGATTRLFLDSAGNFVDVPTDDIVNFEPDLTPAPAPAERAPVPTRTLDELIVEASRTHGIDADFIASVIRTESSSNPRAVSPKGARGLMQLMPGTAEQLGVKDSFNPEENIQGGTRYLRELLLKYNGDAIKALAAYNAGPHRVAQYSGVPPYRETRAYVSRTLRDYNRRKSAGQKSAQQKQNTDLGSRPATRKKSVAATAASTRKPA